MKKMHNLCYFIQFLFDQIYLKKIGSLKDIQKNKIENDAVYIWKIIKKMY